MEYWDDIYLELADKITVEMPEKQPDIPVIEWVDLWHEQVGFLTEELPFPSPAVFISFILLSADDKGLKGQLCNTQVDLYLFYETFSDTYQGSVNRAGALKYLKALTGMHKLLHGTSGLNYSEMRRVGMNREDSGGAGNLYKISFQCMIDDMSATPDYNEETVNDINLTRDTVPVAVIDTEPFYRIDQ